MTAKTVGSVLIALLMATLAWCTLSDPALGAAERFLRTSPEVAGQIGPVRRMNFKRVSQDGDRSVYAFHVGGERRRAFIEIAVIGRHTGGPFRCEVYKIDLL